jgi:ribosomal protein S27AE
MAEEALREPVRMCGRCGGEMSAYGALYAGVRISFRPQDAKFMTLETGEIMTKAIMCGDCGSIEVVGDVNKLRRLTSTPRKADSTEG